MEIDRRTDELIAGAIYNNMKREDVEPSVRANYLAQKLMAAYDCNAFAAPCPDMCATRRLNENRFTLCLNHSLNNEQGICSACEYDLSALLSMELAVQPEPERALHGQHGRGDATARASRWRLSCRSLTMQYEEGEVEESIAGLENVCYTFHATPPRNLKGFGTENAPYGLQLVRVQRVGRHHPL